MKWKHWGVMSHIITLPQRMLSSEAYSMFFLIFHNTMYMLSRILVKHYLKRDKKETLMLNLLESKVLFPHATGVNDLKEKTSNLVELTDERSIITAFLENSGSFRENTVLGISLSV